MSGPSSSPKFQRLLLAMKQAENSGDAVAWTNHCSRAIALISRAKEPLVWARLQGELGTRLHLFHEQLGDDALDRALHHLELALQVIKQKSHPKARANLQHILAGTYTLKSSGNRSDNIETAIRLHNLSLEELSEESE